MGTIEDSTLEQDKIRLYVKELFEKDVETHRVHLETQLSQVKWAISIIITVAGIVLIFFVGKSYFDLNRTINAAVEDRVVDYAVVDSIQKKLTGTIADMIDSRGTQELISDKIEDKVSNLVNTETSQKLQEAVDEKISQMPVLNESEIIRIFATVPIGCIFAFAGSKETIPNGWLICDGQVLKRSEYSELFQTIENYWGSPDDLSFNLPDFRGRFLRGADLGAFRDPDRELRMTSNPGGRSGNNVGTVQNDSTSQPKIPFQTGGSGRHQHRIPVQAGYGYVQGGDHKLIDSDSITTHYHTDIDGEHFHSIQVGGDSETRPINAAVLWIIKVK